MHQKKKKVNNNKIKANAIWAEVQNMISAKVNFETKIIDNPVRGAYG